LPLRLYANKKHVHTIPREFNACVATFPAWRGSRNQSVCWPRGAHEQFNVRRMRNNTSINEVPGTRYSSPAQWRLVGVDEDNQFRMR